ERLAATEWYRPIATGAEPLSRPQGGEEEDEETHTRQRGRRGGCPGRDCRRPAAQRRCGATTAGPCRRRRLFRELGRLRPRLRGEEHPRRWRHASELRVRHGDGRRALRPRRPLG